MDEKQEVPTDADTAGREAVAAGSSKPGVLADGTHWFPLVDVSIPAHGVNGNGTGEVTWHPERGLQFRVEATADLGSTLGGFFGPTRSSARAGAVMEPSREPQLVGRCVGCNEVIRLYQLAANVKSQSQSGTAGFEMKTVVSGTAVAATVRIERDSDLSHWHETIGERRLLIPDLWMHQWPKEDKAEWKAGDTYHSSARFSCPLTDSPKLTLFSARKLPKDRYAAWLVFEPSLIPQGERDWYTPEECLATLTLLSFFTGKRLPFLWMDRFTEESHLTRTYYETAKVDDFRHEDQGYQPVPFRSVQHGGSVVAVLPTILTSYLTLRKWFDLDWIVGPLWYATTAYLDDKLGLASVALERFATALEAYLDENPEQKRPKLKFLTKQQSRAVRRELSIAVEGFAKEQGTDLTQSRLPAVNAVLDRAVEALASIDHTLFPDESLPVLRARMSEAVKRADESTKLNLNDTQLTIIGKRIDTFAQKTNPDKLVEALEFDGISVSNTELEAVMKRNDCLHGRRTLLNGNSLSAIEIEVDRFDTLRTLINKVVLARLGYRGLYVDYAHRPPQRQFPVKNLADELTPLPTEE